MERATKLTRNEDGSVTASYADSTSKASTVKLSTGSSSKSSRSSGSSSSRSSSSSSSGSNGATKVMVRNGYTITATPTKTGYESPNYDHEEPYTDAFGNVRYYPADQYGNSTGAWHSNLIVPDYSKKPADQSYGSYFSDLNFGYNQEYEDQYVYYRPASMVPTITIRKNDSSGSSGSGSGGSSVSSYQGGGIAAMRGDSGYDSDGGGIFYGSSGNYGYGSYLDAQNVLIDAQISAILSQLNSGKQTINQMAGDAARQAYINMKTTENALPQAMAAAGQSGGLTQSALLDLYTNYERSRNDIELDRNNQLAEIENTAAQAEAEGNIQKAQAALDYQKQLLDQAYQQQLMRQEYQQELGLLAAKNGYSARSTAVDQADAQLMMLEAQEALEQGGNVEDWLNEYRSYLSQSQLDTILNRYWNS